jgi:hypothetical protein
VKAKVGEITMENELLRERPRRTAANQAFAVAEAEAVGQSSSPSAGRLYGLAFSCRVVELPRSSAHAAAARAQAPAGVSGQPGSKGGLERPGADRGDRGGPGSASPDA